MWLKMAPPDIAPADPSSPWSSGNPDDRGSPETATLVGRTLPGGVLVLDRLGANAEGTLYHAKYPTGLEVVLLILRAEAPDAARARRERLEQAIRIQHRNVAAIYEMGELEDGSPYAILEQLAGQPLATILAAGRAFTLAEALDIAVQAAAGLAAAHQAGFVHGNLSPHTMLVTDAAEGRTLVKLVRFTIGPALRSPEVAPPAAGESARYASPERLAGFPPDERSDVFSLGAVLHRLLTGHPPEPGEVHERVPAVVHPVLGTALASSADERYQTIAELEAELERIAAPAVKRTRVSVSRPRTLVAAAAGAAVLAAAIALLPGLRTAGESAGPSSESGPALREGTGPGPPAVRESTPQRAPPPAPARTAPTRTAPPARPDVARAGRQSDSVRKDPSAAPESALRPARRPPPSDGETDADPPIESGMLEVPPPEEPPPPTMEERAGIYLRIGLDEARALLGRPAHAIEGAAPLFLGLARSRFPPFTAGARPLVRSVYMGPNGSLILLDQQRIGPGTRVPPATETSWRAGDVLLHLHGDARPAVLRNFARRVR